MLLVFDVGEQFDVCVGYRVHFVTCVL